MKIERFKNFLVEKLDYSDIEERIDDDFSEIKVDIINMIEDSLKGATESVNMIDVENFISDYISSGKDANMIDGLIEDNDIFNFYLKFQSDIDELLNDSGYMEKSPKDNNVFSLYDVVIDGTKESILLILNKINDELFNE
ncbi:MAG: hypothetical protein ACOC3V_03390 [bacterium]